MENWPKRRRRPTPKMAHKHDAKHGDHDRDWDGERCGKEEMSVKDGRSNGIEQHVGCTHQHGKPRRHIKNDAPATTHPP